MVNIGELVIGQAEMVTSKFALCISEGIAYLIVSDPSTLLQSLGLDSIIQGCKSAKEDTESND